LQTNLTKRWEGIWRSQPERIDLFQQYASTYFQEKGTLPPGFREIVDQLDPDNGYFSMLEAFVEGQQIISRFQNPSSRRLRPAPPPSWIVKDRDKLEVVLTCLEKAAKAPRFQSHAQELQRKQLALLPLPADHVDRLAHTLYLRLQSSRLADISSLSYIVGAKAELCGREKDIEGFLRLTSTWETLEKRLYQIEASSLIDLIGGETLSRIARENLIATAGILGLTDKMEILQRARSRLDLLSNKRLESTLRRQRAQLLREKGSYHMTSLVILEHFRPESEPGITLPEMRAGRMVEYALADRIGAIACWMFLLPAAFFAAIFRFRSGLLCRALSLRLRDLLSRRDQFAIIASGVAPLFILLILSQTPLGGRQWNPAIHGMTIPAGQWLATGLLMIALPLMTARRLVYIRGARLGWTKSKGWVDWLTILPCVVAMIMFGIAGLLETPEGERHFFGGNVGFDLNLAEVEPPFKTWLIVAMGLLCFAAIGIASRVVAAIFSSNVNVLRRAVISHALVPSYVSGMLALAISIPIYHTMERHWVESDHLLKTIPETAPLNTYESRIITAGKKELLKIFDTDE
jgi:hypothetical protein